MLFSPHLWHGTASPPGRHSPLCSLHAGPAPNKLIVVGFNTGMASGDAALKKSWEKDIAALLEQRVLTLFTCANDHSDLKCALTLCAWGVAGHMRNEREGDSMFLSLPPSHRTEQCSMWLCCIPG